jgi:fucose permease
MIGLLLGIIYLSFISLGLPDALLGAAWPTMYPQFGVPVSYMGIVALLISMGTVVSSLMADRLINRFGTGKVTAFSVATTAVALLGFFLSDRYWMLLVWAIPYGLGAGSVDAALNNYVAVHYASRHMSWLHCMWGVGAATGPYIMGFALTAGQGWNMGYLYIAVLQIVLTAVLLISLPMWKRTAAGEETRQKSLSIPEILRISGTKEIMIAFFCYCALEQTAGQWASSYFVMKDSLSAEEAASLASLFYIGITVGRALSGFVTMKLNDTQMIRLGQGILGVGIAIMLLPLGKVATMTGLLLAGFGCAPIYPCVIHSTPDHFGAERSQAIIGVQMASAYVGNCVMPPLFGMIAGWLGAGVLPVYLGGILLLMVGMHERLVRLHAGKELQKSRN